MTTPKDAREALAAAFCDNPDGCFDRDIHGTQARAVEPRLAALGWRLTDQPEVTAERLARALHSLPDRHEATIEEYAAALLAALREDAE
jgi:hypothetical protein